MDYRVLLGFIVYGLGLTSCTHRQYNYVNLTMNWEDARHYCRVKYAEMAIIENLNDLYTAEIDEISGSYVWIGLSDNPVFWRESMDRNSNSWLWSATETINGGGYYNWRSAEPDFYEALQTCVMMFPDGTWADQNCDLKYTFICYNAPSNPPGQSKSYVWVNQTATWGEAMSYCRSNHKDLAMICTIEDKEKIVLVGLQSPAWIGLFRKPWTWSNGNAVNFTNWRSNQPDNALGKQSCVNEDETLKWSDADCSLEYTFLCQGVLKAVQRFIRMKIHTDLDLSDPAVHIQITQQLNTLLRNQRITDYKLRWNVLEIKQP